MNATTVEFGRRFARELGGMPSKELFRQRFQRSLRSCVRRGFSVEESFGMIWVETWEEFSLSEEDQSSLYDELIDWAKTGAK